tara:strand:- start:1280 stop:1738 length:459 start_codon:yes stop_codon:yes gene_type:complete
MITDKTQNKVKMSFHKLVLGFANEMALYILEEHGKDFDLSIKTHHGSRSYGGVGYITIADRHEAKPRKTAYTLKEYKSIANDAVIGTIKGSNETTVKALVAHEIAHWFHHSLMKEEGGDYWYRNPEYRKGYNSPHGKHWQEIYAELRIKFVN